MLSAMYSLFLNNVYDLWVIFGLHFFIVREVLDSSLMVDELEARFIEAEIVANGAHIANPHIVRNMLSAFLESGAGIGLDDSTIGNFEIVEGRGRF